MSLRSSMDLARGDHLVALQSWPARLSRPQVAVPDLVPLCYPVQSHALEVVYFQASEDLRIILGRHGEQLRAESCIAFSDTPVR